MILVKVLGGGMIFSGCLGLGLWYREQLNGRIKALRNLKYILELLSSEIRYGRAALPECCIHIGRILSGPFAVAFLETGRRMEENTGGTFEEAFREEMVPVLAQLPLKDEDREVFLRFTVQTGFADGQMQLRSIEQSMELLGMTEEKLLEENGEKCRMAVGLGAMGGLLLILILV